MNIRKLVVGSLTSVVLLSSMGISHTYVVNAEGNEIRTELQVKEDIKEYVDLIEYEVVEGDVLDSIVKAFGIEDIIGEDLEDEYKDKLKNKGLTELEELADIIYEDGLKEGMVITLNTEHNIVEVNYEEVEGKDEEGLKIKDRDNKYIYVKEIEELDLEEDEIEILFTKEELKKVRSTRSNTKVINLSKVEKAKDWINVDLTVSDKEDVGITEKEEITEEEVNETTVVEIPEITEEEVNETTVVEIPEITEEEVNETTVVEIPETTVEDIHETTSLEIPETTVEDILETTVEYIPETTMEEVVETTVEYIPETTVEEIDETTVEYIPETTAEEISETTVEYIPETTMEEVAETTVEYIPETTVEEIIETTEGVVVQGTYGDRFGDIIGTAEKYIGVPYVWGGKSPNGFDCSGFTQYVFMEALGIDIGGWTGSQENIGTRISVEEAQAGDLYFWGSTGGSYHVAIATGGNSYIHAPVPGQSVTYGSTEWFTPDFAVRVN